MKLLTQKQKNWILRKNIKEGNLYMFPRFGFVAYRQPNLQSGEYININPFTKSLDNELFIVKEKINGFCKGNFHNKPLPQDIYLSEDELSRRELIEIVLLLIISFIPLTIYNLVTRNHES
jgi:hypothetical protein